MNQLSAVRTATRQSWPSRLTLASHQLSFRGQNLALFAGVPSVGMRMTTAKIRLSCRKSCESQLVAPLLRRRHLRPGDNGCRGLTLLPRHPKQLRNTPFLHAVPSLAAFASPTSLLSACLPNSLLSVAVTRHHLLVPPCLLALLPESAT
jgi:hypothetical protein